MFERFTDRARKATALANQEAQRFNHEYVCTEHLMLGIIKEGSGVACNTMMNMGINLSQLKSKIESRMASGPDMVTMGKLPHTPRAKRVFECAINECRTLNHNYVGTEHLMLGLILEFGGTAGQVLSEMGIKIEPAREAVLKLLGTALDQAQPMLRETIEVILNANSSDPLAKFMIHQLAAFDMMEGQSST